MKKKTVKILSLIAVHIRTGARIYKQVEENGPDSSWLHFKVESIALIGFSGRKSELLLYEDLTKDPSF